MKYRPEYDAKVIGKNLKRLRKAKGLSVRYVQEYLRLGTPQAYYKYEEGEGYPQADTLLALMELYEAEVRDITEDHEFPRNNDVDHIQDQISTGTFGAPQRHSVTANKKEKSGVIRAVLPFPFIDIYLLCEKSKIAPAAIVLFEKHVRKRAKQLITYHEHCISLC